MYSCNRDVVIFAVVRMKVEADSSAELLAHQGNYQGAAKVRTVGCV